MKKIFWKKSKISRAIAFVIAFIMMLSPLLSRADMGESTRAAETESTVALDISVDGSTDNSSGTNYIDISTNKIVKTVKSCNDKVQLNLNVNGKLNYNGNEYDISEFEVKYSDSYTTDRIDDATSCKDTVGFLGNDEKIYVYVKPVKLMSSDYTEQALTDTWGYTCIAEYTISADKNAVDNVAWTDSEGNVISGDYANYACIKADAPTSDVVYAEEIRYMVKPAGDVEPANDEWANASKEKAEASAEGEYSGYVGVFAQGSDVPSRTKKLDKNIKIDTTRPSVSEILIQEKDSGGNWHDMTVDSSGVCYLDNRSVLANYRYGFVLDDASGSINSGIKDVKIDGISETASLDGDGRYYISLSNELVNKDSLSLVVTDNAGNQKISDIDKLVKTVDKTLKVERSTWYDGSKVADDLKFVNTYVNKPYVIKYKATSGYPIDALIQITEDTDYEIINKDEIGGSEVFADGIYTYEFEYVIPENDTVSKKITNVYVKIWDSQKPIETVNFGGFTYDCEDPVLENVKLQYYDENNASWQDVTDGISAEGRYFINNKTDNKRYRYYVKATDITSGIKSVKAYTDIGCTEGEIEFSKTDDVYAYEFDALNVPENGLSLYVMAEDNAGNTTMTDGEGRLLVPEIKLADNDISLELVSVKDSDGNKINLAENKYYNKPISITLRASSGYRIAEMYLNDGSEYRATFDDTTVGNIEADAVTKRYQVEYTFVIPGNVDNLELNEMAAYAKDMGIDGVNDVQEAGPVEIGDLFYDATKPQAQISVNTTKWTNSPKVTYSIKSGKASVESSIKQAGYDMSGSVSDTLSNVLSINDNGIVEGVLDKSVIAESDDISGTMLTFHAEDMAGNALKGNNTIVVKYDNTKPDVDRILVSGMDVNDIYTPVKGDITIGADVSDNLTLSQVTIKITDPSNRTYVLCDKNINAEQRGIVRNLAVDLVAFDGSKNLEDGLYRIEVVAKDKASNKSASVVATFSIDNTIPVVTANVTSGTAGGKALRTNEDGTAFDYYMKSDVGVRLTYKDDNIKNVVVTDNGQPVNVVWQESGVANEHYADMLVTSEGRHTIKINAVDMSDSAAVEKQVEFIKDTGLPAVTTTLNGGMVYDESMGEIMLSGDSSIGVTVSDMCVDNNDINYQIIKNVPDQNPIVGKYVKTSSKDFVFTDEADYTFNVYAKDMANNQSGVRSVKFRIDKTAPAIAINGVSGGGTSSSVVAVTFNMKEAFWWDSSGTATIYRKAGDGMEETLLKTIDYKPTGYETNITETLSDTGIYRIEFTASDRVGHTSTTSHTFTIDREAPKITLNGVKNYDVTDKTVDFTAEVSDDFYSSKEVVVTGTRTDISGKVNQINFNTYNQGGNPTTIAESFTEDGIYDIVVTSTDIAGNSSSESVHFIIDKSSPVIGDLSAYDGTVLREFKWDLDLDELVSDLTVCDVHMYLNGSEYDGVSVISDGSYVLLITAEDELGHYVEKSVQFVLDTKAPVFIVTGVEDGEIKNETYSINVSLQLEEDTLEFVTLNGSVVTVNNNTASLDVTEKGEYTLSMKAVDKAGNIAEKTINFKFGEETNWWIWIIIALCVLLSVGIVIIIVVKKRSRNQ